MHVQLFRVRVESKSLVEIMHIHSPVKKTSALLMEPRAQTP
jgi:hypothetical protein